MCVDSGIFICSCFTPAGLVSSTLEIVKTVVFPATAEPLISAPCFVLLHVMCLLGLILTTYTAFRSSFTDRPALRHWCFLRQKMHITIRWGYNREIKTWEFDLKIKSFTEDQHNDHCQDFFFARSGRCALMIISNRLDTVLFVKWRFSTKLIVFLWEGIDVSLENAVCINFSLNCVTVQKF